MIGCKLQNVSLSYGGVKVISNLTFNTKGYSFVGIVGSSGIGKSTILHFLAGVSQAKMEGEICWSNNQRLFNMSPRPVGLVQQGSPLPEWLTIKKFLKMCSKGNPTGSIDILQFLQLFDLDAKDVLDLFPHELSGGMKARIALAGAMMTIGAEILFLDEPFSGVDEATRHKLVELLAEKSRTGGRMNFIVSHSILEVMYLCDKVLFLKNPREGEYREYLGYRKRAKQLNDLRYGALAQEFRTVEEDIKRESIDSTINKFA